MKGIWSIDRITKAFRITAWVIIGVLVATGIAFDLGLILQCVPPSSFWNQVKGEKGKCLNLPVLTVCPTLHSSNIRYKLTRAPSTLSEPLQSATTSSFSSSQYTPFSLSFAHKLTRHTLDPLPPKAQHTLATKNLGLLRLPLRFHRNNHHNNSSPIPSPLLVNSKPHMGIPNYINLVDHRSYVQRHHLLCSRDCGPCASYMEMVEREGIEHHNWLCSEAEESWDWCDILEWANGVGRGV